MKRLIIFGALLLIFVSFVAAECGNLVCEADETIESCPEDCGNDASVEGNEVCGDGVCGVEEGSFGSCEADCGTQLYFECVNFCGDGGCQQDSCQGREGCPCFETFENCPEDCTDLPTDLGSQPNGSEDDSTASEKKFTTFFWIGLAFFGAVLFILVGLKILRWLFWLIALLMIILAIVFWFVL